VTATYGKLAAFVGEFAKEMRKAVTPRLRREVITNIHARARREGFEEDDIDVMHLMAVRELRRIHQFGSPGRKKSPRGSRAVTEREFEE